MKTGTLYQEYRAYYLYEKYIMHGCNHPIPLSTNTTDEILDGLFSQSHKLGFLDSTIFSTAESEVLDFLIAEVFPMYEKMNLINNRISGSGGSSGKSGSGSGSCSGSNINGNFHQGSSTSTSTSTSIVSTVSAVGNAINNRRKSLFKSPDKTTLTNIMQKILGDPIYLASFKRHMINVNSENALYAYNEIIEIKD